MRILLKSLKTRILVLDDDETRLKAFRQKLIGNEVVTVMTTSNAIEQLNSNAFQAVSLDHDLGGKHMVPSGKGTGYEVAQWLQEHPEKQPANIIIHSFNPVGAQNIASLLPQAKCVPGLWSYDSPYIHMVLGV
jgi:CheY-like chemotaxis protein